MDFEPVLQVDRGEQAREILAAPGPVTFAEAMALALLTGAIFPPASEADER